MTNPNRSFQRDGATERVEALRDQVLDDREKIRDEFAETRADDRYEDEARRAAESKEVASTVVSGSDVRCSISYLPAELWPLIEPLQIRHEPQFQQSSKRRTD